MGAVAVAAVADPGTSESGVAQACYTLGLMYSTGQGMPLDNVEAHKWFNLASMQGLKDARLSRAQIAQDMSPMEIADAQRRAREWLRTR